LFWVDSPGQSDDPATAYTALDAVAARAVTVNRIPRVVFQSSIGAERRSGMGEIDGLAATEQLLDATGAAVIHLRCGYFFTNLLFDLNAVRSGRFEVLLDVDHPFAWVAPRDSAEVAAAWLLRADWTGRRVQAVHGGGSGARPSRAASALTVVVCPSRFRVRALPTRAQKASNEIWASARVNPSGSVRHHRCAAEWFAFSTVPCPCGSRAAGGTDPHAPRSASTAAKLAVTRPVFGLTTVAIRSNRHRFASPPRRVDT